MGRAPRSQQFLGYFLPWEVTLKALSQVKLTCLKPSPSISPSSPSCSQSRHLLMAQLAPQFLKPKAQVSLEPCLLSQPQATRQRQPLAKVSRTQRHTSLGLSPTALPVFPILLAPPALFSERQCSLEGICPATLYTRVQPTTRHLHITRAHVPMQTHHLRSHHKYTRTDCSHTTRASTRASHVHTHHASPAADLPTACAT